MNNFRKFLKAEHGSLIILTAAALVLMVAILAIVIDLGRTQNGSLNNQAAADASALAAAQYITTYRITKNQSGSPADILKYTQNVYMHNIGADQADASVASFNVDTSDPDYVTVTSCLKVNNSFAKASFSKDNNITCSSAKASVIALANAEIVFALDISNSMSYNYTLSDGSQITKLKALQNAVQNLMQTYRNNKHVFWGVVPYSGMVDLGPFAKNIVANDLSTGQGSPNADVLGLPTSAQPNDNLSPHTEDHGGTLLNQHYYYDAFEDKYMDNFARPFNDTQVNPTNPNNYFGDYALNGLQRVPLTSREGNEHPEDPSTITFDDEPPTPGHMFQAYWHQPYDFFMMFDQHEADWDAQDRPGACGTCYELTGGYERQISGSTCVDPTDYPCGYDIGDPARPTNCDMGGVGEGSGN